MEYLVTDCMSSSLKMLVCEWTIPKIYEFHFIVSLCEPRHDKTKKVSVRPAKTQIRLGIRLVWLESSLSAWRSLGSLATHWAHSEDSDQSGRMLRLIWVFAGRKFIVLVLSCRGSYYHYFRMVYSPAPESHYIYFLGSRKKSVKNWTTEKQMKTCIQIQHGRNL